MIDQELLDVAYEDEDGMASTIILDQEMARKAIEAPDVVAVDVAEDDADGDDVEDDAGEAGLPDAPTGVGVETIVMEGESVRDALEEQALEEARQRGEEPEPDAELAALKKKLKAEAEAEARARPDFFDDRRMVGGLVLLCALLVLQGIHFSRSSRSTGRSACRLRPRGT